MTDLFERRLEKDDVETGGRERRRYRNLAHLEEHVVSVRMEDRVWKQNEH